MDAYRMKQTKRVIGLCVTEQGVADFGFKRREYTDGRIVKIALQIHPAIDRRLLPIQNAACWLRNTQLEVKVWNNL